MEDSTSDMRVTMAIPTYSLNEDLEEMAIICALTYRKQVDELIICEDGGRYSEELSKIADIYIYSKTNQGYTKNVNKGWKISTGDYTMIVNSDTQLFGGTIRDLCVPSFITQPKVSGYNIEKLFGGFFCVPRELMGYGYFDETLPDKNYGSDSEYEKLILPLLKTIESVDVYHKGAATTEVAGIKHP